MLNNSLVSFPFFELSSAVTIMRGGRRNLFGDWRRERDRERERGGNCFVTRSVTGDGKEGGDLCKMQSCCCHCKLCASVPLHLMEVKTWHALSSGASNGTLNLSNVWRSWFPLMPRCGPVRSCPECNWGLSLQGKRRWKWFTWIISWDSFPMLAAVFTQRRLLSCQSFDIWDWFSTALSSWSLVRLSYSNTPQVSYINIDLQYKTLGDIINEHA